MRKNKSKSKSTSVRTSVKKTKKGVPKELSKLSKKHTSFIAQLLKPNPQMKVQKSIKNKNLKNLKLIALPSNYLILKNLLKNQKLNIQLKNLKKIIFN